MWNFDTSDWRINGISKDQVQAKKEAMNRIVSEIDAQSSKWKNENKGITGLEHDIYDDAVNLAIKLVETVQKNGMNLVSVGQCLKVDSYDRDNHFNSINSAKSLTPLANLSIAIFLALVLF